MVDFTGIRVRKALVVHMLRASAPGIAAVLPETTALHRNIPTAFGPQPVSECMGIAQDGSNGESAWALSARFQEGLAWNEFLAKPESAQNFSRLHGTSACFSSFVVRVDSEVRLSSADGANSNQKASRRLLGSCWKVWSHCPRCRMLRVQSLQSPDLLKRLLGPSGPGHTRL